MTEKLRTARPRTHGEGHFGTRGSWLRAAILGADDGIVSIASLMIGVAASAASLRAVLVAGVAGLVAGALSMAAGEYVSVSSQRDAEDADIDLEKWELDDNPAGELRELALIYEKRGLEPELARRVAEQLSAKNRLDAHLRDELGLNEAARARPIQAALISAASFSSLALVPIVALLLAPESERIPVIALAALLSLGFMGALGGHVAGAPRTRAALRVLVGGGLAMAVSALVGRLFGIAQN
ncbi:MAG TPA: VIT family protein [Polyangiaceae bacterium]|jgi:VIT1/CCC1 family predicted Fe2+/Mn2+ transporter|nr:VIT family protein [Polyangiaceae bacterium]